jgi:hypothetical protein
VARWCWFFTPHKHICTQYAQASKHEKSDAHCANNGIHALLPTCHNRHRPIAGTAGDRCRSSSHVAPCQASMPGIGQASSMPGTKTSRNRNQPGIIDP